MNTENGDSKFGIDENENLHFNDELNESITEEDVLKAIPPRETGCSDVGGCRISVVNIGDMASQGLLLSIFISHTSTTQGQKLSRSSLY